MRESDFVFDSVQLCSLNVIESYIDSPAWLKIKKATINRQNGDNKCIQYAATVGLNYQEIEADSEKVSNIAQFIKKIQLEWNKISVQIRRLEKV